MLTRRRFLTISAAATAALYAPRLGAEEALYQWRGVAMGADASITLAHHPRAEAIVERALAEITRLERIFSLHMPGSALVQLNAAGTLEAPPFELLECLALVDSVHAATGGLFDPTIQPLWTLYAQHHAAGRSPEPAAITDALARTGWSRVSFDASGIRLAPGAQLSLNGVAQGYVADRVADLLRAEGLTDLLVNTGELRALGGHPRGGGWSVGLDDGQQLHPDAVRLENAALASSSPMGTTFDQTGEVSHILDPRTGQPAPPQWRMISVMANRAGLADALSTGFCLMDRPAIDMALERFPTARLVFAA